MKFAGRHALAELHGVPEAVLSDVAAMREALRAALTGAGATVLDLLAREFEPHGVTVLALLGESHASVHTWPDTGNAFVDVFTCGDTADPDRAVQLLATLLGAARTVVRTVPRGWPTQVSEPLGDGLRRVWDVSEVLWAGRTAYQDVLIGRTAHGVTLFCDGERQSAEASQLVYHEALVVPALLLARRVDRVLVIGSSEGVVSEIAVAAGALQVDHVDIDAECVRACARWLPYGYTPEALAGAERGLGPATVHYADGWEWLDAVDRPYDVIVVDLPDERPAEAAAQHNRLYGVPFLHRAAAALTDGGVLVGQVGCATLWRNETLLRALPRFHEVFPSVLHYGSDEHEWSFLSGMRRPHPDPVAHAVARLPALLYRPRTLDSEALRRGAVLPHATRRGH